MQNGAKFDTVECCAYKLCKLCIGSIAHIETNSTLVVPQLAQVDAAQNHNRDPLG